MKPKFPVHDDCLLRRDDPEAGEGPGRRRRAADLERRAHDQRVAASGELASTSGSSGGARLGAARLSRVPCKEQAGYREPHRAPRFYNLGPHAATCAAAISFRPCVSSEPIRIDRPRSPTLPRSRARVWLRVAGRVALVDPQRIASGRGARIVLQLVYPIGWSMPHLFLLGHGAALPQIAQRRRRGGRFSSLVRRSSNPFVSTART